MSKVNIDPEEAAKLQAALQPLFSLVSDLKKLHHGEDSSKPNGSSLEGFVEFLDNVLGEEVEPQESASRSSASGQPEEIADLGIAILGGGKILRHKEDPSEDGLEFVIRHGEKVITIFVDEIDDILAGRYDD